MMKNGSLGRNRASRCLLYFVVVLISNIHYNILHFKAKNVDLHNQFGAHFVYTSSGSLSHPLREMVSRPLHILLFSLFVVFCSCFHIGRLQNALVFEKQDICSEHHRHL